MNKQNISRITSKKLKVTFANLHSALVFAASDDRREATFIFLACSLIAFS